MTDTYAIAREKGLPIVHLNGTSREELTRQYRDMHEALSEALKAMRQATPHERDYYVLGDGPGRYARERHSQRYKQIAGILREIEDEYIAFDRINPNPKKEIEQIEERVAYLEAMDEVAAKEIQHWQDRVAELEAVLRNAIVSLDTDGPKSAAASLNIHARAALKDTP